MKRILVMTLEQGTNYGGMLQAYALQRTLKGIGFEVETTYSTGPAYRRLIKGNPILNTLVAKIRGSEPVNRSVSMKYTQKFLSKNIKLIDYGAAVKKSHSTLYDAYVTGSDQVWRKSYTYVPHNLFSFVRDDSPRISYAASFGKDNLDEYSASLISKTRKLAQAMTAVSVRESSGVAIAAESWGVEATHHVDPTLLVSRQDYSKLIDARPEITSTEGGLFSYVLDPAEDKQGVSRTVASIRNLQTFTIIDGDENQGRPMPPVEQWLRSFRDAEFVVTDSFHGTVFSIIFNKPFIAIGNKGRGMARFTSILKVFGLEGRLVSDVSEVTEELLRNEIDWERVNATIEIERNRSFEYLKKHLG